LVQNGGEHGSQLGGGGGLQALQRVHLRLSSEREPMTEELSDYLDAFFGRHSIYDTL
jgi:hypothetical protein